MRLAPFAFVAFMIAAPVFALPHAVRADTDASKALAMKSTVISRGVADLANELVERAKKPVVAKIDTSAPPPTVCNSNEYKPIREISWLECARQNGAAFLLKGTCWDRKDRDFASGGAVEKGDCYVRKF